MPIGKHKDAYEPWKVGEMEIEETDEYRYLGDIVSSDGKNTKNLKARKDKINAATANVKAQAGSQVLNRVGTTVLLELHDKRLISSLLNNAESWNLNKGEEEELEKIEIQTIKNLFDLPLHTPTVAILFSFGILHTTQKIEKKMLMWLHKTIQKDENDWPKKTLNHLKTTNLGWYKKMKSILEKYDLPTDHNVIGSHRPIEWKRRVEFVIENESRSRLQQECFKKVDGNHVEKTKTKGIYDKTKCSDYTRSPSQELLQLTKYETKTVIIARFGMLACGTNFKGSTDSQCSECKCLDNEDHRLNYCKLWRDINYYDDEDKVNFDSVFSDDLNELRSTVSKFERVWNTKNANGCMNTP